MSKQKPKKRWWVSRDKTGTDFYGIHHMIEKPKAINDNVFSSDDTVWSFYGEPFREMFALRVRKGECKEIERPVLKLVKK